MIPRPRFGSIAALSALLMPSCLVAGLRYKDKDSPGEHSLQHDLVHLLHSPHLTNLQHLLPTDDSISLIQEGYQPSKEGSAKSGSGLKEVTGIDMQPAMGTDAAIRKTVEVILPSKEFVQAASERLRQLTAASRKELGELGDLYIKVNSRVDPEFLRKLKAETPQLIHRLHMGGHGPLYYPHMHVANHRVVTSESDDLSGDRSAEPFTGEQSIFQDGRVTLTLVCFLLTALSGFFNFRSRKDDNTLPVSHDHHGSPSSDGKLLSVWDATISTFSAILSMGLLSLPYTMSLAGWIAAPLMILFTCLTGYTAHLLVWVLQEEVQKANRLGIPAVPGWGFLLRMAYGPKAEQFVNLFMVVELWGYVLSGIVATAMNLNQMFDEISVSSAIGITVLVQFVLTNVPMKTLTRVNLVCNALFIACCLMYIVTGLSLPSKPSPTEFRYVKSEGILAAIGIIVFSPCGHSLYPSIMHRMEQPERYPVCLRRAYFLACLAYVGFAVPGYYLFGNAAQPSAVRNIGADLNLVPLPNLGWMNSVAAFCMVMKMSGLQPLILTPLNSTIELMVSGKVPKSVVATLIPPVVLTISAVVALHFANQMATLLNIVGSVFCMSIAFILPVLCYWKLKQNVPGMQQVIFFGLVVMGGTFALLGLMTALNA